MGQKRMSPKLSPVLALEGVLQDGALVCRHQQNAVKAKCCHLKEKEENYCKSKQHSIRGSMCIEEGCTLTLNADDNTWMERVAEYC